MDYPLVSVCMSSYNNAHYVLSTLESISQQTYSNIELIIVDDCSTDNSVSTIEGWLEKNDIKCKFIKHEKNSGVCKVANSLIENSSGKYVSIIASDDLMLPEKISHQVAILESESNEVGLVYSDAYLIGSHDEPFFGRFIQWHRHFFEIPQGNIFPVLMEGNFMPAMSALWRMECFDVCGKFDETLAYEDYDILLRISLKFKFVFSDFVSVKYRVHNTNLHKKLQGLAGAESNFTMFYKHIGIEDGKYDDIIKEKLMSSLLRMYDLKSNGLKDFYQKYCLHYADNLPLKYALLSGVSYYHLARMQRMFSGKHE